MKCQRCGTDANEGWKFCPRCGYILKRRSLFGNIFERMNREIKEMDRELETMNREVSRGFERNFEVLDISPFFRKPMKGGGFSIKISSSGREKPRVSVRTFGGVKRGDIEQGIGKMCIGGTKKEARSETSKDVHLEGAETTEEPETSLRRTDGGIAAKIKLPGVMDMKDIEVKSLENSIEVKAMAGKKAYFKILTKPENANIVKKGFGNGVLRIELA